MEVLVVGGAAMDVKAHGAVDPRTSNPGTVAITPGGVGRNIAENLARLGRSVSLVAAIGADPWGSELLDRTAAAGVDVSRVVRSPLPTGAYVALLDAEGELVSAVADLRATEALVASDVPKELIADALMVVLDGNLAVEVVASVLALAADARVPVVLDPVSVAKASRLRAVFGLHPVFAVTPDESELDALLGADWLHANGVAHVWVSRGAAGSLLSAGGTVSEHPAVPTAVVDVTGAGDALTAGFVHGLLAGLDPLAAVHWGHVAAALTVASEATVRADLLDEFGKLTW